MSDKQAHELYEAINRRIKLARLESQVDLISELSKRPAGMDEWALYRSKLAELKREIEEVVI